MGNRVRRHDGGSVRQLPSKRWQVRVRDKATNRLISLGTFKTKADATAALTNAAADVHRGAFVSPERGQMPLSEYAESWLAEHPSLAPATVSLYRYLLDDWILPNLGDRRLYDLDITIVNVWFARLGKTTSASNRAKSYRLLRAILNRAVRERRILLNPCQIEGGGKEHSEERPIATIPQVFAIASHFPERFAAIVPVAAFGSLRVGECAGLQRADVDPLRNRVHVRRQVQRVDQVLLVRDPKSASKRAVTLPEQVMQLLQEHMAAYTDTDPEAYVFTRPHGTPVDHNFVGKLWRPALAAARKDDPTIPRSLRFHDLRGTGATLSSAQGATLREVMDRLGHKTIRAAMIYQHASEDRADTIAQLLGQAIDQAQLATVKELNPPRKESG